MDKNLFIEIIKKGDEAEIIKALRIIETGGSIASVKLILALLKHPNRLVASQAVISAANLIKTQLVTSWAIIEKNVKDGLANLLKKLDPSIINHISKDLYSKEEKNRHEVLQVLGLLGQNEKIKQVVITMLTDQDERMRATAVSVLRNMLGTKDTTLMYRVLHDPDPRVRANGVEAIETVGNKNTVSTLITMKKDPSNRVRGNVIKALYNLGFKDILNDLRAMLSDDQTLMRATAGWVIGEIGKDGEDAFLDIIGEFGLDRMDIVRQNMVKALIKIGGEKSKQYCECMFELEEIEKANSDLERMRKFRG